MRHISHDSENTYLDVALSSPFKVDVYDLIKDLLYLLFLFFGHSNLLDLIQLCNNGSCLSKARLESRHQINIGLKGICFEFYDWLRHYVDFKLGL